MKHVEEFCKCGAGIEGDLEPDRFAKVYIDAFWNVHSSPDCGRATKQQAEEAFRAKEAL